MKLTELIPILLGILGASISPAFVNGTEFHTNLLPKKEIHYSISNDSLFEKENPLLKSGQPYHVTESGDTIVTFKDKQDMENSMKKNTKIIPSSKDSVPQDPQHPMYGLNSYIPAHEYFYQTGTNWYGSGDVDGDGIIDMDDHNSTITGTNPFNDGTHRGDTDLDGVSGTASDKQIIYEYIQGQRTHINLWELESETEKQNHLEKVLEIDPTDQVNHVTSGWDCNRYSGNLFFNCTGVYDFENSPWFDNGTNLQYDPSKNGIFRIPLRLVTTKVLTGQSHRINSVFLGDPNNQNALEFDDKLFIEPQTDEFYEIGNPYFTTFAKEKWYGYCYSDFFQQWSYTYRDLVHYDISTGSPVIVAPFPPSNFVISWNAFEDMEFPSDTTQTFPADTSVIANGQPENLYVGTNFSYSDQSTQTNNQTCSDFSYDVFRTWDLVAGAYDTSFVQTITSQKPVSIVWTEFPSDTIVGKNDPVHPDYLGWPDGVDTLATWHNLGKNYYDELISATQTDSTWHRHWTLQDLCNQSTNDSIQTITRDLTTSVPEYTSTNSQGVTLGNPYPNPTNSKVTLPYVSNSTEPVKAVLFNSQGQKLEEKLLESNQENSYWDVSSYPAGVYYIQDQDSEPSTKMIIIKP